MFRVEPINENFLEDKSDVLIFKVPPIPYNTTKLIDVNFFMSKTYRLKHYGYKCNLVGCGIYMYHDITKSTVTEKYYIVKIEGKPFYYLMKEGEQAKYMVLQDANLTSTLLHEISEK